MVPPVATQLSILFYFIFSGKEEAIYNSLSKVDHLHVYRKQDIPEEYHYKYNRRIMPIFVTADEGWYILENSSVTLQRSKFSRMLHVTVQYIEVWNFPQTSDAL